MNAKSQFQPVCEAVQRNCHIADARFAGDDTLCIYLLKMRELFRWEHGFNFRDTLPKRPLAEWLIDRESLWEGLEEASYDPLQLDDAELDPFDTEAINAHLVNRGLVYSAGLGRQARPHFFLADLESQEQHEGFRILVSSREHARDLSSPPAMTLGNTIFLRREALRRLLWQRIDEWRWQRPDNAMARAIGCYDFDADIEAALEEMTERELESVRLHEIGEILAGRELGPGWEELLLSLPRSRAEFLARAVRDLLADCISTLPALLEQADVAALHFYMANLSGMRRELFPALRLAYDTWLQQGDLSVLVEPVSQGADHWLTTARNMLAVSHEEPAAVAKELERVVENARL